MKYHFKIHKENIGYWAQCIELPGCITEGNTLRELQTNMKNALNLYVKEPEDSKDLAILPNDKIKCTNDIVEVPVDPSIAFAFLIRYFRIKLGLSQKEVANRMGFENLYSYQRLETAKSNPSLKMISKLKEIFPEFSIDYVLNVN